jgi:prepilin-type processing-associated H-X9-DG protein
MLKIEEGLLAVMTVRRWLVVVVAIAAVAPACWLMGFRRGEERARAAMAEEVIRSEVDEVVREMRRRVADEASQMPGMERWMMSAIADRAEETHRRVESASNLRRIGEGLAAFEEKKGRPPRTLTELAKGGLVESKAIKPPWAHVLYAYLGKPMKGATPTDVIAYESGTSEGTNILFGDGHVEFFIKGKADEIIEEQIRGTERGH